MRSLPSLIAQLSAVRFCGEVGGVRSWPLALQLAAAAAPLYTALHCIALRYTTTSFSPVPTPVSGHASPWDQLQVVTLFFCIFFLIFYSGASIWKRCMQKMTKIKPDKKKDASPTAYAVDACEICPKNPALLLTTRTCISCPCPTSVLSSVCDDTYELVTSRHRQQHARVYLWPHYSRSSHHAEREREQQRER